MAGGEERDLEALVRRVDPDRWLTSRFVTEPAARADLIALYAFDHELARAERAGSQPLIAEMRLAWWREAVDAMFGESPPPRHPAAVALAQAVRRRRLPREALEAMIEGRIAALEAPVLDADQMLAWAQGAQGSAARLAAWILDPAAPTEAAAPAGRAWGLALLRRAGRTAPETLTGLLREALAEARAASRRLGVGAFPAALPARLARFDLAGRAPGPLEARVALALAVATGRV